MMQLLRSPGRETIIKARFGGDVLELRHALAKPQVDVKMLPCRLTVIHYDDVHETVSVEVSKGDAAGAGLSIDRLVLEDAGIED